MDTGSTQKINRRSLLTGGLALAGAAGLHAAETPTQKPAANTNLHPPIAEVKAGKLRGYKDGRVFAFLGVPYARAERFEMPKPVTPWEGIRGAQAYGPICPIPQQTEVGWDEFVFPHRFWIEDEKCQVLNVWTQSLSPQAKKPVMVWMHGGGFTNGSSIEAYAYDGKALCDFGDVVAVTVNHRLNILGTLDLSAYGPEFADSRHTGMADLVAALQWIRENIEAFGGDPGNVTIFGQSGGGGKVTRLMHMPAAEGLFHKVICQSGGTVNYRETNPAGMIKGQQAMAAETLKNLGLDGSQIDRLKKVPYRELLAAGMAANKTVGQQMGRTIAWDPIADDRYVLREFCDWAHSIPYIAGTVMTEFNSNLQRNELTKNEWTAKEVDERLTTVFGDRKGEVAAEFRRLHPNKKVQDVLFADKRFRSGAKTMLALKLEKAKAPVYSYMFTYEYQVNGGATAFHCSEIAFAFHALREPHLQLATGGAASALALQDKVSQAWVNFARTGNPSQPGLPWKPYTLGGRETMIFDTVSEVRLFNDDKLVPLLPPDTRG